MKVITKYILKQIIKVFLLCHLIFILLYLIADFIQKVDDFVVAGVSVTTTLQFVICRIPTMMVQIITPAATLISIIVVICQMKKNKEIMAMKACGLDLHKVFQPVIVFSIITSIFTLFLAEEVVPYTNARSTEIQQIEVRKRPQASFQEWYKSNKNIYWIKHFDIETKTIDDPVFYFFDDNFNLIKKISGKSCRWVNGEWEIKDAKIQTMENGKIPPEPRYILDIPETPETFISKMRKPDDMNYAELKRRAKKYRAQGYDNTTDLVNLYMKLSYPFMGVVFALIAIPLGLWEKIKGIPLSITLGMLTVFLLFVTMGIAKALGSNGTLPPILAAWTANILFSFSGIYLLMSIKK